MKVDVAAVIVAHPDDEVLAAGGTLAKFGRAGIPAHVLVLATGLASRGPASKHDVAQLQEQAREAVVRRLRCASITFEDFPDNRMDAVPLLDVVKRIEAFLVKTRADSVFTHHPGDVNVDHGVTTRAVMAATRPLPGSRIRRVWAGEVISSSEWGISTERFAPNAWVDIAATLEDKLSAMTAYTDELRDFPHPRSLEALRALAQLRGSEIGTAAAEAFVVLREISQ